MGHVDSEMGLSLEWWMGLGRDSRDSMRKCCMILFRVTFSSHQGPGIWTRGQCRSAKVCSLLHVGHFGWQLGSDCQS